MRLRVAARDARQAGKNAALLKRHMQPSQITSRCRYCISTWLPPGPDCLFVEKISQFGAKLVPECARSRLPLHYFKGGIGTRRHCLGHTY